MPQINKIKQSICNVYYAMINTFEDENISYCTPIKISGAVAISLTPLGDSSLPYANGKPAFVMSNNQGYIVKLEFALVPTDFCQNVLNEELDENNVLIENSDKNSKPFALLFELDGDVNKIRYVLYNCNALRFQINSSSKKEYVNVETETIELYAIPLENGLLKAKTNEFTDKEIYDSWYKKVYVPNTQ